MSNDITYTSESNERGYGWKPDKRDARIAVLEQQVKEEQKSRRLREEEITEFEERYKMRWMERDAAIRQRDQYEQQVKELKESLAQEQVISWGEQQNAIEFAGRFAQATEDYRRLYESRQQAEAQLQDAAERERQLVAALEKYGTHKANCNTMKKPQVEGLCSCGLEEALGRESVMAEDLEDDALSAARAEAKP